MMEKHQARATDFWCFLISISILSHDYENNHQIRKVNKSVVLLTYWHVRNISYQIRKVIHISILNLSILWYYEWVTFLLPKNFSSQSSDCGCCK